MIRAAGILVALALGGTAAAQQPTSVYTPLDLKKCRHLPGSMEEDYGAWTCRGHLGVPVFVTAGDQRSYVSFGRNAKSEPAAKQTLAAFNGEGRTIEWRGQIDGRKFKPFATIMRWSTTVSTEDPPVRGQVLVVTRLDPPVCHVGYVDARANPDANVLAQKIADDHARHFKCGVDRPVILGMRGPGFSGPYGD